MNAKTLDNEELAFVLRSMRITGVPTTPFEKDCLEEAAERLETYAVTYYLKESEDKK